MQNRLTYSEGGGPYHRPAIQSPTLDTTEQPRRSYVTLRACVSLKSVGYYFNLKHSVRSIPMCADQIRATPTAKVLPPSSPKAAKIMGSG